MEFVYVVPRSELFPECYPQGLVPFRDAQHRRDFEAAVRSRGFFVEREKAERMPDWKQLIPYTIFLAEGRVLLMRRLSKGGESRLHDKLSIGVGGHINPEDLDGAEPRDPIAGGTRREIEEEVDVRGSYEIQTVGFLNDDSNPVGAVHLGVVQIATVQGSVRIREEDVLEGDLVPPGELQDLLARGEDFESWSSILVEHLDDLVPTREPAIT